MIFGANSSPPGNNLDIYLTSIRVPPDGLDRKGDVGKRVPRVGKGTKHGA